MRKDFFGLERPGLIPKMRLGGRRAARITRDRDSVPTDEALYSRPKREPSGHRRTALVGMKVAAR